MPRSPVVKAAGLTGTRCSGVSNRAVVIANEAPSWSGVREMRVQLLSEPAGEIPALAYEAHARLKEA
jgi:hypothetical protein